MCDDLSSIVNEVLSALALRGTALTPLLRMARVEVLPDEEFQAKGTLPESIAYVTADLQIAIRETFIRSLPDKTRDRARMSRIIATVLLHEVLHPALAHNSRGEALLRLGQSIGFPPHIVRQVLNLAADMEVSCLMLKIAQATDLRISQDDPLLPLFLPEKMGFKSGEAMEIMFLQMLDNISADHRQGGQSQLAQPDQQDLQGKPGQQGQQGQMSQPGQRDRRGQQGQPGQQDQQGQMGQQGQLSQRGHQGQPGQQGPPGQQGQQVQDSWDTIIPGDAEVEVRAREVLRQVIENIRRHGFDPGGIREIRVGVGNNTLQSIIQQVESHVKRVLAPSGELTWGTLPHPTLREVLGRSILPPGTVIPKARVGVVVDTSGSMPDLLVSEALGVIFRASQFRSQEIVVVPCDARAGEILQAQQIRSGTVLQLQGGGGTVLWEGVKALARYARERNWRMSHVVILTDGYSEWPSMEEARETFAPWPPPYVVVIVLCRADERPPSIPRFLNKMDVVCLAV